MSNSEPLKLSKAERIAWASRVKPLRQEAGLTQEELAVEAKVSRATINTLESGSTTPQTDKLEQVLRYLGVDLRRQRFDPQTETWLTMMGS